MKTLNERVYEYLLGAQEPQSVSMVEAAFPEVPRMILGKALLGIAAEGIAYYAVKDGKMYFSTDSAQGRNSTPCHANLKKHSTITGLLSALMAGKKLDPGAQTIGFPEKSDAKYPVYLNHSSCDSTRYDGKNYSISFPKGFRVVKNPDDSHDYEAWAPCENAGDGEEMSWAHLTVKFNPLDVEFSRETAFMQVCAMEQLYNKLGLAGTTKAYQSEQMDAFYILCYPNTLAFIARPDGIMFLRVDWNLDNELPPRALVEQFVTNWLDSFTYQGKKQYLVLKKLTRPEMLKPTLTEHDRDELSAELELGINDYNRMINAVKNRFTLEKATKTPTTTIYNARTALQQAADRVDDYLVDMMAFIDHYAKVMPGHSVVKNLYTNSAILLNIVSEMSAEIKIDGGTVGPYNSATDLVISGKNNESTYTVHVYPPHYPEFLRCVMLGAIEHANLTGAEKDANEETYKVYLAAYEAAQKQEHYLPEFKVEGGLLAAYLGEETHVTLPAHVKAIGDFSFKSSHQLESVELGEHVTFIGFSPFDDCPNLKTVTIPDSVEKINGPLLGFTFGKTAKLTIRGYADSYAQTYAKENKIPFEAIAEDNLDAIITLEENSGDFFDGLFLPVPKGFVSSEQLPAAGKKAFSANEGTSHLRYACVPADAPKGLADYKNTQFSISGTDAPRDIPNALEIAKEVEQRLNGLEHAHDKFRTCTAEKGKIVIKYDLTREGVDNDLPWATYVVLMFHNSKMHMMQIFINGNYTHRQQEFAVKKWASSIRFEKAVRDERRKQQEAAAAEEKKKKEAAAMELYQQEHALWKEQASSIEQQRNAELEDIMAKTETDWIAQIEKDRTDSIRRAAEDQTVCQQKKAEAEGTLASLGMFKFAAKKAARSTIELMTVQMAQAAARQQTAEETYRQEMSSLKERLASKRKQVMRDLEKRYPIPAEPQKPRVSAANTPTTTTQRANQSIKDALLDTIEELGQATLSEIRDACPEAADLSNQRVSALLRQLVTDGRVQRTESYSKVYFSLAD